MCLKWCTAALVTSINLEEYEFPALDFFDTQELSTYNLNLATREIQLTLDTDRRYYYPLRALSNCCKNRRKISHNINNKACTRTFVRCKNLELFPYLHAAHFIHFEFCAFELLWPAPFGQQKEEEEEETIILRNLKTIRIK